MKKEELKELHWWDLDSLNYLAEETLHKLRFTGFLHTDDGLFSSEVPIFPGDIPACLDFNKDSLFEELSLADLCELSLHEIEDRYLSAILPRAVALMRQEAVVEVGAPISKDLSDGYLKDLFALRWKDNALLWCVQRQRKSSLF